MEWKYTVTEQRSTSKIYLGTVFCEVFSYFPPLQMYSYVWNKVKHEEVYRFQEKTIYLDKTEQYL